MNIIELKAFPDFAVSSGHLFAHHFSSFISSKAVADDESGYLKALASLLVHLQSDGHTCLDLQNPPIIQLGDAYHRVEMPSMQLLINDMELHKGDVIGSSDDPGSAPLILQCERYLYLHRYWHYEQQVVRKIRELSSISDRPEKHPPDILFDEKNQAVRQVEAVRKALTSRLSIIAGGPGTGKTTIAVKIIAANLLNASNSTVALAAPTGKAAARMKEAIEQNIEALAIDDSIKQKVSALQPYTLHRLLGARYRSPYFKHNCSNPLSHDLLIVDEASMIDLPMMAKLLDAVGDQTTIVLIGDPNQLPPVEVGSIFEQIVHNPSSANLVTVLEENFRSKEAPEIMKLCEHMITGDSDGVMALLNACSGRVRWNKIGSERDIQQVAGAAVKWYKNLFAESKSGSTILKNSRQFRILTVLRSRPFGAESFNFRIKSQLDSGSELLLVTRNDPDNNIFNGDIGVRLAGDHGELTWIEGREHPLSPLRIPEYQLAYAMTGHKAQGSEFEEVHIVLPTDENCPLLTREWLYTAVSRAKQSVTIWANEAALRKCLNNKVVRSSGLQFLS